MHTGFSYVFGMIVTHLGTALAVKSGLGAGFWSALYVGLSTTTTLSAGVWFCIVQVVLLWVNAKLKSRQIEWAAIIPILIESLSFHIWLEMVLSSVHLGEAPFFVQVLVFLIGMTVAGMGIGLYVQTGYVRSPVDELFLAISHRYGLSIAVSQTAVAATITAIAYVLDGPVGLGTLLSILVFGQFIQFFERKFSPYFTSQRTMHEHV
ncbi:hypothetical protein N781_16485 [Pontibacillus halophilus JSM 076056 = DSM 19796]|uniref:BCR, YitT family protein n=1 Tax=Pontibacillus halophilus JSM 076056 = DSM 19796 TaxID=1385510 RepID=A0A0A5I937_9BACI|nr:hypothetical protein [Pontibacillus halophilus]KGX92352.1 hypothetical protein N781_16485 [Pontibacillus halophilus JSM 076056 = DSM 19796]